MLHQGITIRLRHRSYRIVDRRHARWPDWPAHTASRRPNRALLEAITADPANSIPLRSVLASCGEHRRDWHRYHPTQKEIVRQLTDLLVTGRITILPVLPAPAPYTAARSPATPAASQPGDRLSPLSRSRPAPAQLNVAKMSTEEKMEFAIRSAELARGMLRELGDIKMLVASFVVVAAAMAAIAATGIGALVEGVTVCLLIVGAATAGVQIGRGINKLIEFYEKVRRARTGTDLRDAGISFADGVASLGVGAFFLLLSFLGARARGSGRYWNGEESTGAQAARPGRSLKSAAEA